MKAKAWINIAAAVVGLASGPSALAAAKASVPPIEWDQNLVSFLGSAVGTVFVIGIQVLRSDPKHGRWAILFFTPISISVLAGGIGALTTSVLKGEFGPASLFILDIRIGLVLGVFLSRLVQRAKVKGVL